MPEKIHISSTGEFCDTDNNIIQLRGVNLDPSVKIPAHPFLTTHSIIDKTNSFFDDCMNVSFIDHPMSLNEVDLHVNKLKSLGYNTIRLPITWESLEHEGPGIYDFKFMDYIIELLRRINEIGGIYVYLDPHQDVWSRFCGGSGAPYWTLLAAGFQPKNFEATEASVLHNYFIDPKSGKEYSEKKFPKMLWASNYTKLACQTMFTLFFAGKSMAPKCILNEINIQDYLQEKFINAFMELYRRIQTDASEVLDNYCIIGMESMNEPNGGYLSEKNLNIIPKDRDFKLGSTPTGFQSFMLGEGFSTIVDEYEISIFGPSKKGTRKTDPNGTKAWLNKEERDAIDSKYGWERGQEWDFYTCIWRLHGVWEISTNGTPKLLKPDYFSKLVTEQQKKMEIIDERYFINNQFVDYYSLLYKKFRELDSDALIFLQPPVLKEPPKLLNSALVDKRTVYACHYYDGMSLMFKTWNRRYNADTFGIVRGKYTNPILGVVIGEGNIRKSLRKQLKQMKEESKSFLGPEVPVFFTEIGMPFDMDNKKAYKDGSYTSQTSALDALHYALEGNNLSYSLWCYCSKNSHEWGDNWNNEDFSIWSSDDKLKDPYLTIKSSNDMKIMNKSESIPLSFDAEVECVSCPPTARSEKLDYNGFRALDALLRPFPVKINGSFIEADFNLTAKSYNIKIKGEECSEKDKIASWVFLPSYHFPLKDVTIHSSSSKFTYDPTYQILKWFHGSGLQTLEITLNIKNSKSYDTGCIVC